MLLAAGLVLALAAWAFTFALPREGLWGRTYLTAAVLIGFALVAGAHLGPIETVDVPLGLAAGAGWLAATHVGYRVLARVVPSFAGQVDDLYRIRAEDGLPTMVGAVAAMGVAEELFFRGVVQDRAGLPAAVAAYGAVQVVERKWALVVAALLGGTVWGLLYWATDGILAPIVAHVLWTAVLTFVRPLPTPQELP